MLVEKGADTSIRTKKYETALDMARRMGNIDICKILSMKRRNSAPTPTKISVATPGPGTGGILQYQGEPKQQKTQIRSPVPRHSIAGRADEIAKNIGLDPKTLDKEFSDDLLVDIANQIPNWMEYAKLLMLTPQDINSINTDPLLTFAMKTRKLLEMWKSQQAYSSKCHYRFLVEVSCKLGHADVAGQICEIIKESQGIEAPAASPMEEYTVITEDLAIFKGKVIGDGIFGTVLKGEHKRRPCAVKLFRPVANEILLSTQATKHPSSRLMQGFEHECTILARFDHPNIIKHLATEDYNGHSLLVLELMDCNLREFCKMSKGKELPLQTQTSLCHDISAALEYIHARHIIHTDLCSDNILLDRNKGIPVAKVCDFGMSKCIKGADNQVHLNAAFGRTGFAPPEATGAGPFDSSYDIFSFGALMVQIVRCLPTIESKEDRLKELDKINRDHPIRPLIVSCLSEDKKSRPSAMELETELCDL